MSYSLSEAAARLEAAVERLGQAAGAAAQRVRAAREQPSAFGLPMMEVAALGERLEATIARLRAALPEGLELGTEFDLAEVEAEADTPPRDEEG